MLGSVGASVVVLGGDQPVSIGGLGVYVAGVSAFGVDGAGLMGRGTKQPAVLTTKLNTKRITKTRFIIVSLRLKVCQILPQSFICGKDKLDSYSWLGHNVWLADKVIDRCGRCSGSGQICKSETQE